MGDTYKNLQENFVSNHSGSTVNENVVVIVTPIFITYFSCFILSSVSSQILKKHYLQRHLVFYILENIFITLPLCFTLTVFSDFCSITLLLLIVFFFTLNVSLFTKNVFSLVQKRLHVTDSLHWPFITNFRSIINILTAICILAVDFKIFPRRYAKTENFGFSIMDTGVGFFIIANAIVVKPVKKECNLNLILKIFSNTIPLIILGLVRFYSVETLDYQKHISEYGIHWNFFFTLAIVKVISSVLLSIWPENQLFLTVTIMVIHQFVLFYGVQDWIINFHDRNSFISANKEGILSLPGYISLYLGGTYIGSKIFKAVKENNSMKICPILLNSFIICALLTFVSYYYFNISRRLVNVTYVCWMWTLSSLQLFLFFITYVSLKLHFVKSFIFVPKIFEAINYNGLLFFLLANVFTGIINILVQTIHISSTTSISLLSLYILFLNSLMCFLFEFKIKIKWW